MEQRQIVVTLHLDGKSLGEIAKKTGFAKSTVQAIVEKHRQHQTVTTLEGRGRKRKTTPRQDSQLTKEVKKDRFLSATSVAAQSPKLAGVNVSRMTVARRLQEIGLNARVARKKPFLKPIHIRRRLQFARDHVD